MTIMKTSWVVPDRYALILGSHEVLPQWELQQGIVDWNGITLVNSTDPVTPVIDANLAVALDALLRQQRVAVSPVAPSHPPKVATAITSTTGTKTPDI
ncbi:hypothetical protein ACWDVV_36370, partial [Streptomyces tendae]